jgi:hypothetical protein
MLYMTPVHAPGNIDRSGTRVNRCRLLKGALGLCSSPRKPMLPNRAIQRLFYQLPVQTKSADVVVMISSLSVEV